MNISYLEKNRIFKLDTPHCSYCMAVTDDEKFLTHVYFGSKISEDDLTYLLRTDEMPFVPSQNGRDRGAFLDSCPMEYPGNGVGDYRESAVCVADTNGNSAVQFYYTGHRILKGKKKLEGLPATFADDNSSMTLEIDVKDPVLHLKAVLSYSVFEELDVVTRSVQIINEASEPIFLTKIMSLSLDMDQTDYQLLTLHGAWGRERQMDYRQIGYGRTNVGSVRGETSHQEHPFIGLVSEKASQESGAVYGFHFVYSGNFLAQVERSQFDSLRVSMGIHPDQFRYCLESGAVFQAPEVVCVYSDQGLGGMTRTLHDLYRNHLIRSAYKDRKRPILINNWEATYFDFDTDKLIAIAQEAQKDGIEMLVMDDGWFGRRNDDNVSLGDWQVNEEKLKGGLKHLVDEVNKIGLKFGIWFEPEMISPDSDLYRKHPDWAIAVPDRTPCRMRNQYVLDLSRQEVREYVYESVAVILRSTNIAYVKWDMNRQLSDLGSAFLGKQNQGELCHRYMLGVYELQERLITEFPELLLENCSGGGARFDPGMLYYSPQIWCSDDADAIERLSIQEGTSLLFPLSTMGAHVSDCPNHTVGRVTPFATRGNVALAGTFGYELDITRIAQADRQQIPGQVALYHKYNDLVRSGDYYRIASYRDNHLYDCYSIVAKDQSEALVTFVQVLGRPNMHSRRVSIPGLDLQKKYRIEGTDTVLHGDTLLHAGLQIPNMWGDYQSALFHLVAEK